MIINVFSYYVHSTSLYSYFRQPDANDDKSCVHYDRWMVALTFLDTRYMNVGRRTSVMIRGTIICSIVNHLLQC